MKDVSEDPNFTVRIWENGEPVDLRMHQQAFETQLKPIEFHMKVDGAIAPEGGDAPSFCFVLVDRYDRVYFAQISERMLTPALKAMGYVNG